MSLNDMVYPGDAYSPSVFELFGDSFSLPEDCVPDFLEYCRKVKGFVPARDVPSLKYYFSDDVGKC